MPSGYWLVGLGGACGAMLRYLAASWFGAGPWTTFAVNVSGSFCIGLLAGSHLGEDLRYRLLLGVGLLGGYTTFSALELEALLSARAGDWIAVAAILAGSMIAGFGAVWLGYALTARS